MPCYYSSIVLMLASMRIYSNANFNFVTCYSLNCYQLLSNIIIATSYYRYFILPLLTSSYLVFHNSQQHLHIVSYIYHNHIIIVIIHFISLAYFKKFSSKLTKFSSKLTYRVEGYITFVPALSTWIVSSR